LKSNISDISNEDDKGTAVKKPLTLTTSSRIQKRNQTPKSSKQKLQKIDKPITFEQMKKIFES
jgi:hypothetical protein